VMNQCLAHDQFRQRGKRMIEGTSLPLVYITWRTAAGLLATGSVAAEFSRFLLVASESASDGAMACRCGRVLAAMNSFSLVSSF